MNKKEWQIVVEEAVQEGLMKFWEEIAKTFPEAEGGDFPPDLTFEMDLTMEKMVHSWLYYNHPTYGEDNK